VRCFVVAGFLLTSASCGPSAIAEPLVINGCSILVVHCEPKKTGHNLGYLKVTIANFPVNLSVQTF